jgi:hypothetical protein
MGHLIKAVVGASIGVAIHYYLPDVAILLEASRFK